MHCSLVQLALAMAAFNVATAAIQFLGWQRLVKQRVDFSFLFFDRSLSGEISQVRKCTFCLEPGLVLHQQS